MKLSELSSKLRKKAEDNIIYQNGNINIDSEITDLFNIVESNEGESFWLHVLKDSNAPTKVYTKVYNVNDLLSSPTNNINNSSIPLNKSFKVVCASIVIRNNYGDEISLNLEKDNILISTDKWSYSSISELETLFKKLKSLNYLIENE